MKISGSRCRQTEESHHNVFIVQASGSERTCPKSLALGGPANGRQALSAPPPRGTHEPRPRRSAPPSFSTFVSFRAELDFVCRAGGCRLRLPALDVIPRTGDTSRFQWAPRSRTPPGCRSRFTRRGEEAAEPEWPRDPRRRTKGPGPRPPRGRALAPPPPPGRAKWRTRYKMAAGWAAEWRPEAPAAPCPPRPAFLPTASMRPPCALSSRKGRSSGARHSPVSPG